MDLGGLGTAEEGQREWERLLAADRARRFDLERPPLVRFTLVRFGGDVHRLVMTNHHILWDGWSSAVLLRELLTGYAEHCRMRRVRQPGRDRSDRGRGPVPRAPGLAGPPGPRRRRGRVELVRWPGWRSRPCWARRDPNRIDDLPERASVELSAELTARLTARARTAGVTLNSVVQGLWAVLLGRVTGRDDVVFGGTVSGRTADVAGIEDMVGLLINTLPVRFRIREDEPLLAALARFQDEQADLMDHQHVGLAGIHGRPGSAPSSTPRSSSRTIRSTWSRCGTWPAGRG
ncbi:condensation domain-containing protein [Streptomyces avidinii]